MPEASLADYATPTQLRYLQAVEEHGGIRAAARALNVAYNSVQESVAAVKKKAARDGFAPGHFENGVAPGYLMGKVTVQRGPGGDVERTWERQSPDHGAWAEAMRAAFDAMAGELPRLPLAPVPGSCLSALCNLYTFTDYHMGMLAWRGEGGADWDLPIAERTLSSAFLHMVEAAPRAASCVLNIQGDFLHSDGLEAVTPTSHHVLDSAARFPQIVAATIRVLRRLIDHALTRHERVHLILAEGNHDLASSVWLRQMFAALYENEPRLSVNASELPYYVHQHGRVMLAFHHGHLKKNDQLPLLFAASFPTVWGATVKRYCHTGHRHHVEEKEHAGMTVVQHPTLSARDAYAARGGWLSDRQATAITYHAEFGQVARNTVCPEMLEAA